MLLPALSKAREKARAISCVSNLKQLGTCFALYMSDYEDRLPWSENDDASLTWHNGLVPNYLPLSGSDLPADISNASNPAWRKTVFCCPSYAGDTPKTSYTMNHYMSRPFYSPQVSTIPNASEKVLLADGVGFNSITWAHTGVPTDPKYGIATRHGGNCNVLFADLHVTSAKRVTYDKWDANFPHLYPVQ